MIPENLQILVVEDNPGDFLLVREYLREYHPKFHIIQAPTLQEGRRIIQQQHVDIILLDVSLPDSDGIDSIQEMIRFAEDIPVIVLTGLNNLNFSIDSLQLGVQDYLLKSEMNGSILDKSILYSFERKRYIQELKLSNDRYQYVSKATSDAIWDWDIVQNKIFYNISYNRLFGYPASSDPQHFQNWTSRIHPNDRRRIEASLEKTLSAPPNENNVWKETYMYIKADGSTAIVSDRAYIVYDEQHQPVRMVGAMQDVTKDWEKEEERLKEEENRQKEILQTIIQTQEKERYFFGRELHDNVVQILAVCQLYLDLALARHPEEEPLKKSMENVQLAIREIRVLSHQLAPATFKGEELLAAIGEQLDNLRNSGQYEVSFFNHLHQMHLIRADLQLTIFRIIQEQINNILKHAQATAIGILLKLEKPKKLVLEIQDNGKGFDPELERNGIGLNNIRNRIRLYNGNMDLLSAPGKGCTLRIQLDID